LGSARPEVVRSALPTGARGKAFCGAEAEAKQGNYLIGYSLVLAFRF